MVVVAIDLNDQTDRWRAEVNDGVANDDLAAKDNAQPPSTELGP